MQTFADPSIGPGATKSDTVRACNHQPIARPAAARRYLCPRMLHLSSSNLNLHLHKYQRQRCFQTREPLLDRIYRPEQLITSLLPEVMRVLTSPARSGAVTVALPQDVQAEAYDFPEELFAHRTLAHLTLDLGPFLFASVG